MTSDAEVRVDGTWLRASGLPFAELGWTDRADGGNVEASWSLDLEFARRPAALYRGATVEIMLGTERRWYGLLSALDWNAGTFTASGMSTYSDSFGTVVNPTVATSTPDTAIDGAIARGWKVTRPSSFSSTPVVSTGTTTVANYVGPILDASALASGQRWGVWADGVVRKYADPTTPTLYLAPGALELGETSEETYSALFFQFIDVSTGATAYIAKFNGTLPNKEYIYDATDRGPMSAATAGAIADTIVASGVGTRGWVSSIEVSSAQLTRASGLPADLATVTAGELMRALVPGPAGLQYVDLVVGESKYAAGSDSISLGPTDKVAASLSEVVEDMYARLTGTPVAA